jgi:hypothetical protein
MGVFTRSLLLFLCLVPALVTAPTAVAPEDITPAKAQTDKKQIVSRTMQLTAQEAQKFWPLYEQYQQKLQGLNDRMRKLTEDYTQHYQHLSNERAKQLVDQFITIREEQVKLQRSYLPEFEQVLPAVKVIRYYQIENKLNALLNYELATIIPMVK